MIEAHCYTNSDEYKLEEWPTTFQVLPEVGHYIMSKNGKRLKVGSIEHRTAGEIYIELCKSIVTSLING